MPIFNLTKEILIIILLGNLTIWLTWLTLVGIHKTLVTLVWMLPYLIPGFENKLEKRLGEIDCDITIIKQKLDRIEKNANT